MGSVALWIGGRLIPSGSSAAFLPSCTSVSTHSEAEKQVLCFLQPSCLEWREKSKGTATFLSLTIFNSTVFLLVVFFCFALFADPQWIGKVDNLLELCVQSALPLSLASCWLVHVTWISDTFHDGSCKWSWAAICLFSQNQAKSYHFTVTFKPSFLHLNLHSKMDEPQVAAQRGYVL